MSGSQGGATEPSRHELRAFGFSMGGAIAALFGVVVPWLREAPWPTWPWLLAAALGTLGALAPTALGPLRRGWLRFGELMSRVTTPLILGVLFFGVFAPIARVRALRGRDPLKLRASPDSASYRVQSRPRTASDLEKPF